MFKVINLIKFFGLTSVRMECKGQMLKNISQKNKSIWVIPREIYPLHFYMLEIYFFSFFVKKYLIRIFLFQFDMQNFREINF